MKKAYKDIVFDVDGTLIDTEKVILSTLRQLLKEEYNLDKTDEELVGVLGIPVYNAVHDFLGFSDEETEKFIPKWMERLKGAEDQIPLMPGVKEMLNELKKEYHLGIVTSRNHESVYNTPSITPILPYFDTVVTMEESDEHKPKPAPLHRYMDKRGILPKEMIYVGDSIYDMLCAENAGVDRALAVWGAPGEGREIATYLPETPQALCELLAGKENETDK